MRQRLSSEPDRYRGRRRVPTPPRSRYAAVVTTAFVGAGIVALGAGALPDAKAVSPTVLDELERPPRHRQDAAARADERRPRRRGTAAPTATVAEPDVWLLPLQDYTFTSPYGDPLGQAAHRRRPGRPRGHAVQGDARRARSPRPAAYGGYGNAVIVQHADGTEAIYGHSPRLLVKEGEQVKAGRPARPGGQHRPLLRHPPAPGDPCQGAAGRPGAVPPGARSGHQAASRGVYSEVAAS